MSKFRHVALSILLLLSITTAAHAGPLEQLVDAYPGNLADFVTPEGTFDFDLARSSGFEGALNIQGVTIDLDQTTGEISFAVKPKSPVHADLYEEIIGPPKGITGPVWAMCVYNGNLIIGGDFTAVDQVEANHVAMYDGDLWHSLGRFGLSAPVRSLIVLDGKLIAGGDFRTAGNDVVNKVAAWDGKYWNRLGHGMYKSVCQLGTVGDMLVGSGDFHSDRKGCQMCYVVAFSGHEWSVVNVQELNDDQPTPRTSTASLASK